MYNNLVRFMRKGKKLGLTQKLSLLCNITGVYKKYYKHVLEIVKESKKLMEFMYKCAHWILGLIKIAIHKIVLKLCWSTVYHMILEMATRHFQMLVF